MTSGRYPVVVIHGLAHARSVLEIGRPATLLSAQGAALYAGAGWWRAVIGRARDEHPDVPVNDILDCGDAPGLALGAMRIGQHALVLSADAPGFASVAAIAASLGSELLTSRPPALDMADRSAAHRLHDWLQLRTAPGDSGDVVS